MQKQKARQGHFSVSWIATLVVIFSVFLCCFIFAQAKVTQAATGINQQINYQGRLLTDTGAVVPDGNYNIEFKIYQDGDGVLGGGDETLKWTESRTGGNKVLVKNGYFSVYLGAVNSFGSSVDWNQDTLWLSINIGGTGAASWDGEMTPYTRFSSTPYALNTKYFNGLQTTDFVQLAKGAQTDSSSVYSSIFLNKTGATANILQLQKAGSDVFVIANDGDVTASGSLNANGDVTFGDAATDGLTFTGEILGASPLSFEGATNDDIRTTFAITDPTTARTITFPNATGSVVLDTQFSGDATVTSAGVLTISANAIGTSEVTDGTLSTSDLSATAGITNGQLANSSIGLALGTSGTDINWGSGSVSLGGTATLNLPDASASNRGLVTTGTQTFAGAKTFSSALAANGGITFDNSTDTLSAFTLAGTQDANNNLILNIGNAGTDFTAGGGLTLAGVLNANATGKTAIQIADSGAQDSGLTIGGDTNLYRSAADQLRTDDALQVAGLLSVLGVGTSTITGDLTVNGADIFTSSAGTATLFNTNATTLNIGGAVGAGGINFAGGSGSTGCTIDGSNGNLTCSGAISTTATSGSQGWWGRSGSTLSPVNSGDNITTSGSISTTGTGGLTVAGNTFIGNGSSAFSLDSNGVDISIFGAISNVTSIDMSSYLTAGGLITAQAGLSVSGGTASFTNALAANGGITFDNSTDTLSAFTLAGTQDANNNLILNIGNAGTDFTSGGGLNVAGTLAANGGLTVQPASAGTVGATITAKTAQTADLFRVVDEFGDSLVAINPNVGFKIKSSDGFTSSNAFSVVKLDTTETIIIGVNSTTPGLYTESTSFNLINTAATTLNIGGAAGAGGINFAGGYGSTGCSIDGSTGNLSCNGSLTLGAGLSATTGSFSGALAANGGITFDNSTDTVGAHTLAGAIDANNNLIINIGDVGTDFVSGGGLTLAGTLTGNGVVSLGDGGDTFAINSTAFDVSTAGALSGITTISASGNINTTGVYQQNGQTGVSITCGSNNYLSNIALDGGIITGNNGCRSIGLSDARVKNNVVELEQGILDQIKNVRAVSFDFDCDHELFTTTSLGCETTHQTGVIAQELAQVFPGLVRMEDDGYYRVDYNALSVYNLKAVTEIAQFINSDGDANFNSLYTDGLSANIIKSATKNKAVHIDGDVIIDGTLVAKQIKTENTKGLDELSSRVSLLENSSNALMSTSDVTFGSISTNSLNVSLDLNVDGAINIGSGLTVAGLATFDGETVFNNFARFSDEALFSKDVKFEDRVSFGNDNAGFAEIDTGESELRVKFSRPYETNPVVNLSVKNGQFVNFAYKDLDKEGFTIVLKDPADTKIEFSWTAFEVKDARTVSSTEEPPNENIVN